MLNTIDAAVDGWFDSAPVSVNLPALLVQVENDLSSLVRKAIECRLQNYTAGTRPVSLCRDCGATSYYVKHGEAIVQTKFGPLKYCRAVYRCAVCRGYTVPLDEQLHPQESLARIRKRLAAGANLRVGEMAAVWGLGGLGFVALFPIQTTNFQEHEKCFLRSAIKEGCKYGY